MDTFTSRLMHRFPSITGPWAWAMALLLSASLAQAAQPPLPYTEAKRYSPGGQLTGIIRPDPDGSGELGYPAVRHTYNSRGLRVKTEYGELSNWQDETVPPAQWNGFSRERIEYLHYDAYGRKTVERSTAVSGTTRSLTQFSYDSHNRLQCQSVRMNPSQMGVGSLPPACQTGSSGAFGPDRVTRFHYDNLDNLTRERRAVGTAQEQDYARFEYTGTRLDARIDANGNRNEYTYDNYDRLTHWYFPSKTSPGSASSTDFEHYRYDAAGNRTYLRKRDGDVIRYSYDRLNRRTLKDVHGDSHDVYYRYNLQGLRTRARFGWLGGDGVTIEYNGFGEVTFEEIDMEGLRRHERHTYDANGNRISRRHSDDYGFEYQYDRLDRLKRVQDILGRELAQYHYDRYARPKSVTTSGGASTQLGYEGIGRVSSINYNFSGGAEDLNLGFGYNPASQITRQTVSNGRYHHKGDRGLAGSYEVNGLNQYTRVAGQDYEYDDNGNLVSDGVNEYTYDVENRLVRVRGAYNADLVYDPLGRLFRVTSHDTGQTRRFVYSGDQLTAEYRGEGDMLRRYAYGAGARLAPLARYEGASLSPGNRRYLHTNHQGSVIAFSDKDGQATDLNTYDPFGVPGAGNTSRFAYTGQLWLAEIGLYHYRARVYNPYVGRFLQTDPIGYEDQMNLYAYVGNDPLNVTDPTGKVRRFIFQFLKEPVRTAKVLIRATKRRNNERSDRNTADSDVPHPEVPEVSEEFSGQNYKPGSSGGDGAGKRFSQGVRDQAREESSTCVFCDQETTNEPGHPNSSEVDHSIPKSRGGNNSPDNAQNTCRTCNRQKGSKTSEEFEEIRKRQGS